MKCNTTFVVLTLLLCAAWFVGCADVSSTGPTPPEFFSEYRFLNADSDLGDVNISLDLGPSVSGLEFMEANPHQTYPSGNRVGIIPSTNDTLRIAMTSDQRATVMLLPQTGATREFIKLIERRIFDPAAVQPADVTLPINDTTGAHLADTTFVNASIGKLRLVQGVPDAAYDFTITGASIPLSDTTLIENQAVLAAQDYRTIGPYTSLPVGDYTVTAVASDDTTATEAASTQVSLASMRMTSVLVQTSDGVAFVNLEDN